MAKLTSRQFEELCDRLFASDALSAETWSETDAVDDRVSNQSLSRDRELTPPRSGQVGSPSAATVAVRPSRAVASAVARRPRRSHEPAAKARVERRRSPASVEPQRGRVRRALFWLTPWLVAAASLLGLAWIGDQPSSHTQLAFICSPDLAAPKSLARTGLGVNLASLGPMFPTATQVDASAVLDATAWREAVQTSAKYKTQKIRDVQVGTWVLADNPQTADGDEVSDFGEIVPGEWRHLVLRMKKADGGTLDIDLLRPLWWLALQAAERLRDDPSPADDAAEISDESLPLLVDALAASLVPGDTIELDLEELGAAGPAEILAIRPCPAPPPCPSPHHHLVTGKFSHSSADILHVFVEGLTEPIGVTPNHPFWSQDRQNFISAVELATGERLLAADGSTLCVLSVCRTGLDEPVHNLEVDGQHVYFVSPQGIVVHNAYPRLNPRARRAFAESGRMVYPTAHNAAMATRVRGKGLGGVWKYEARSAGELRELQETWIRLRRAEGMLRHEIEGRIHAATGARRLSARNKALLDILFGDG